MADYRQIGKAVTNLLVIIFYVLLVIGIIIYISTMSINYIYINNFSFFETIDLHIYGGYDDRYIYGGYDDRYINSL